MNEHERKMLDDFFKAITPNAEAYKHATFSYLALKKGAVFELAQGRLVLQSMPPTIASRHFQSQNIIAGICRLDELKLTVKGIIDTLLSGTIRMPQCDLSFPPEQDRFHSVYFNPFHSEGIPLQHRQMQLFIRGDRRDRIGSPKLDWELKAAATPFDNVQELCSEFLIGATNGDSVGVEILALNIAAVAADSSVHGIKAHLIIHLANGLERDKSSIGYRIIEKNVVVKRGTLAGAALSWTSGDDFQRGETELDVRAGAVIHCIANYAGEAQHHFWIADPATAPNPLRAVHEAFDSQLVVLQDLMIKAQHRGANARDIELAVAWLLWILGFSPTHIGGTPKTSDAPDLIATTPQGHFVVIECTTGLLKEDHKLPHLVGRTERIRQSLAASGNQHLKVLPIMVTTKTRDEIKAELESAYKLGILVATREDFPQLINRTILFPDANRLYAEAEEALRRFQNPPAFQGS